MTPAGTRLIVALDTQSEAQAQAWAESLDGTVDAIKLGLEFVHACGTNAVARLARNRELFLDLKLHDIPNTVASAIRSLSTLRPALLTIHAAGGRAMIAAAREAIDACFPENKRPVLLAVTVLTSLDEAALHETGIPDTIDAHVLRLARLALAAGADGVVCSALELPVLRATLGPDPVLVVPGIRPHGSTIGDQKRIMTPAEAAKAGADWIVVGRPITQSADPKAIAKTIQTELG